MLELIRDTIIAGVMLAWSWAFVYLMLALEPVMAWSAT